MIPGPLGLCSPKGEFSGEYPWVLAIVKEIRGMSKKLSERNNNRGVRCLYGNGDLSARDDRPSAGNFYLSWLMYIVW